MIKVTKKGVVQTDMFEQPVTMVSFMRNNMNVTRSQLKTFDDKIEEQYPTDFSLQMSNVIIGNSFNEV